MPDNYYDDADEDSSPQGVGAPKSEGEDVSKSSDSQGSEKTSILPKSFFGGEVKPGDTCTVRVTAVHENDVECEYEGSEGEKPEDEDEDEPATEEQPEPAQPAEGSMASMMQ